MTSMAIFLDKRYFKEQGVFYKKQMTFLHYVFM